MTTFAANPGLMDPKECNCDCVGADQRKVSSEEIAAHCSEKSCWVLLKGDVWDLTPFLADHPGGPGAILEYAGRDATTIWESVHPPEVLKQLSPALRIGAPDMDLVAKASQPAAGDVSEQLLHVCKLGGSTEVDALLAAGANPNHQGGPGREAPLHWAARKGAVPMIASLLSAKASLETLDSEGQTPLILAARNSMQAGVKSLLAAKSEINAQDSRGETALHAVAGTGSVRVLKLLLAAGAELSIKDKEGNTAADTAAERGNSAAEDLINEKLG